MKITVKKSTLNYQHRSFMLQNIKQLEQLYVKTFNRSVNITTKVTW